MNNNYIFTDIDGVLNTVSRNDWTSTSVQLYDELCDEFKIPKTCLGNNVKQDGVENFKGVVSKSNFVILLSPLRPYNLGTKTCYTENA